MHNVRQCTFTGAERVPPYLTPGINHIHAERQGMPRSPSLEMKAMPMFHGTIDTTCVNA